MNAPEQTTKPIEEAIKSFDVRRIFGEPVENGTTTIIPVAEFQLGFGYGYGGGDGPGAEPGTRAVGYGGGGGAAGKATPAGHIVVEDGQVRYEPIINRERVALAALAVGVSAFVGARKILKVARK